MIDRDRMTESGLVHFKQRRRIDLALRCFEKALEAGEDPLKRTAERWICCMLLGRFDQAWRESDLSGASFRRDMPSGSRALIRCLRGLGDAIQFLRYAPMLRSRCASVYVQGPPRLLPLLRCIPGIDRSFVFGDDRELDGCWDIECSDLPYLFRSGLNNIPPPTKIKIPADTLHRYRNHESLVGPGIRAGVVWEAGAWNRERSIPASLLAPLAEVPGIRLISLQRGKDGGTCGPQVPGILDGVEPKDGTILDTAAIATQIDLVISVDSMVGHLAASLGKPVWLLLPYAADWRWMLDRQDSPWYPTMRLFRQAAPGDWASVVRAVNAELRLIARVAVNQLVEIA